MHSLTKCALADQSRAWADATNTTNSQYPFHFVNLFLFFFFVVALQESAFWSTGGWAANAHSIIELSSGVRDRTCCEHFIWFHFIFYLFLRTILKLAVVAAGSFCLPIERVYGWAQWAQQLFTLMREYCFECAKINDDEDARAHASCETLSRHNVNDIIHNLIRYLHVKTELGKKDAEQFFFRFFFLSFFTFRSVTMHSNRWYLWANGTTSIEMKAVNLWAQFMCVCVSEPMVVCMCMTIASIGAIRLN